MLNPPVSPYQPTELTNEEYKDLLEQIRKEFSVAECEGELIDAARYDDVDVVRAILQIHPDLHKCKDSNANTALHMAAANGHIKVTELLVQLGADAAATNTAGNTPLHWASSNGHEAIVQVLLKNNSNMDVLKQNEFGRSALTEGFTSQNTLVVKSLLEHDSATEERLVQVNTGNDNNNDGEASNHTAITHDLVFQGASIQVQELAIAESDKDTILGQVDPSDDTTGLGIWAASLVLTQWLVSQIQEDGISSWTSSNRCIVELGAGCGVPSLALAKALASLDDSTVVDENEPVCRIYATDFNPKTVDNLQHNIELNESQFGKFVKIQGMMMNWQDPSTWPKEPVDLVVGSDLIYQSDMVPLLVQTINGLLKAETGRFLYVARADGERQGHLEFLQQMELAKFIRRDYLAPETYTQFNPLASQDDDLCFLHFHELTSMQYQLFEFRRPT